MSLDLMQSWSDQVQVQGRVRATRRHRGWEETMLQVKELERIGRHRDECTIMIEKELVVSRGVPEF